MFEALNMGSQVTNEEFIAKAIELKADALLVSQTVTQKDIHIKNLTELVEMLEAEGLRDKVILACGGPRISHELAKELGYDAGFGMNTYADDVASFIARRWPAECTANRKRSRIPEPPRFKTVRRTDKNDINLWKGTDQRNHRQTRGDGTQRRRRGEPRYRTADGRPRLPAGRRSNLPAERKRPARYGPDPAPGEEDPNLSMPAADSSRPSRAPRASTAPPRSASSAAVM